MIRRAALFLLLMLLCLAAGSAQAGLTRTETPGADGHSVRIDYVDANGHVTFNPDLGYASAVKTLDDRGNTLQTMYLNADGSPALMRGWYSGIAREYDAQSRLTRLTYLDGQGDPQENSYGTAGESNEYDDRGLLILRRYFDAKGQPASSLGGQYAVRWTYDAQGRQTSQTYLDAAGEPVLSRYGYARVVYDYDSESRLSEERYFDEQGDPAADRDGASGLRYLYGSDGQTETVPIGAPRSPLSSLLRRLSGQPALCAAAALLLILLAACCPRRAQLALLLLYIAGVLFLTLGGRSRHYEPTMLRFFWSYARFLTSRTLRRQIINNILLFVPVGTLLMLMRAPRRGHAAAACLPFLIEGCQLLFSLGMFDLDDLVSNLLGLALGCVLGLAVRLLVRRIRRSE